MSHTRETQLSGAEPKPQTRLRRYVSIVAAIVCLVVGGIGAVLPVLPTTPFVLLASFLLVRSSPRLHRKLRDSRIFGSFLRDWEDHHGVRPGVKVWAMVVVVTFLGATLFFADFPPTLQVVLLLLGAIGLTVVMRLPVVK